MKTLTPWRQPGYLAGDLFRLACKRSIPFADLGPTIARAQSGDLDAREVVILSSVRLAGRLAFKRGCARFGSIDREDLIAVGLAAAAIKIDAFDPTRDATWCTFVTPWMRNAMNRAQTDAAIVRPPYFQAERFLADARRAAVTTGPGSHAARWWNAKRKDLHEDIAACPASRPLERAAIQEDAAAIPDRLATLSARERSVIVRRFGIGCDPQSVAEVAEALFPLSSLSVSRVTVRAIESRALFKLRARSGSGLNRRMA